ncbi:MAG: ComEC/Rec2 family competence protein [Oscillospiraceae bacterium]|nr:ComEC/Rec2 family competence protein [Oscillospiraceae bacterium]
MTRKMAWVGFSYIFGLFLSSVLGISISFAAAAVLLSAAAVMIFLKRRIKLPAAAIVTVIGLAAGFCQYAVYDSAVYGKAVALDGESTVFTGKITDKDNSSGGKTAYTLKGRLNGSISCGAVLYSDSISAEIGDKLTFTGTANKISDSYIFPSESYYKSKGIYLRYYSAEDCTVYRSAFSLRRIADVYKNYILGVIDENMPETEGSVMKAMLLGDKSSLDGDIRTMFYRSGCGHIMAVSGIHMTIICTFLTALLSLTPLGRKSVFGITMLILGFFCVMAGLSPSAVRTYIMLFIVGLGGALGREGDTLNSLGIAGIVLTIGSPYAAADTGLILSFAGVVGIGVIAPEVTERINRRISERCSAKRQKLTRTENAFIGSVCACVTTFPVSMLIFDEVSVISPITNTILVPLCTAALLCGAAAALTGGIPFLAKPLLLAAALLCKPVIAGTELISKAQSLYLPMGDPAYKYIAAAVTALIISLMFINRDPISSCLTGIISLCAVTVICNIGRYIPSGEVYAAYVFDGSGGSAVIASDGRSASVIDLGGGASAADKYLKQKGIYDIDVIMLTEDTAAEISAYYGSFGLYDTAAYFCSENSGVYKSEELSDKIFRYETDKRYTVGYAEFSSDSSGGTELFINDHLFYIPSEKASDREAFCTFLRGRGSFSVKGSEYICTDGKGEYISEDGIIYDNCCIEFTINKDSVKERVMFVGGDN